MSCLMHWIETGLLLVFETLVDGLVTAEKVIRSRFQIGLFGTLRPEFRSASTLHDFRMQKL